MLYHNAFMQAMDDALMVEDVFSTYLWTGTGATLALPLGIQPDLFWGKSRSAATDHAIYDSARGATYDLASNTTVAQTTQSTGLTAFTPTGVTLGSLAKLNTNGAKYVGWGFKKAKKFFDIVTWTGNGITGRLIPHSLSCVPGMIVIKRLDLSSIGWMTLHRSFSNPATWIELNDTHAAFDATGTPTNYYFNNTWPTSSYFSVNNSTYVNASGASYIAYLWAHDPSATGIVQCGSFTTDASGNASVNNGCEPQYVKLKAISATGNWIVVDSMRGMPVGSNDQQLYPNLSNAETAGATLSPTAVGFDATGLAASTTYIYLAIRRGPMRTPTDGTKVFNAIARTGTGAAATVTGGGFAPDVVMSKERSAIGFNGHIQDRLRGASGSTPNVTDLSMDQTASETAQSQALMSFDMNGFTLGSGNQWNYSSSTFVNHCLRRAPGFFDEVCYTGTGVARTIPHNLGSVPGMMWVKRRDTAGHWFVASPLIGTANCLILNTSDALSSDPGSIFGGVAQTSSVFTVGTSTSVNGNGGSFVAYLFGNTPGLCKAGSYTGNGTNQDITCGFIPRLVIIKRTDSTGDWKIFDSVRGIVSGNDPVLALNSTAAEVTTTDPIDPIATGFNIAQETTNNLNVNGASYIFWACA